MLYFDHSATTYLDDEVLQEIKSFYINEFGNPASLHSYGLAAKKGVSDSCRIISEELNCRDDQVVFTSGGTESNNLVLRGVAEAHNYCGHIITSSIEHHCVLHTLKYLETKGVKVTYLSVNKNGLVKVEDVISAIKPDTFLVSIMFANNEVGTVQPIKEIGKKLRDLKLLLHTDAVQCFTTMKCDVKDLNVDFLTLSAHKFYGPNGVGLVYVNDRKTLVPQITGGDQQGNLRAGTFNVVGVVGMAKAMEVAAKNRQKETERLKALRDRIIKEVLEKIPDTLLIGDSELRVVHNVYFCFKNIDSGSLLMRLDSRNIAVSSGSACTAGQADVSHVLRALKVHGAYIRGGIRISLGKKNTDEDVDYLVNALVEEVRNIRSFTL